MPLPLSFVLLLSAAAPAFAVDAYLPPHTGGQGCWASIFDGTDYRGARAHLTGPTFLEHFKTDPVVEPDLKDVGGQRFLRAVDSLVVGPNARVIAYEGVNFSGIELVFPPGTHVGDLNRFNFAERVRSLKVQCVER